MTVVTAVTIRDGHQVEDRARRVRNVVDEHLNLLLHYSLVALVVGEGEACVITDRTSKLVSQKSMDVFLVQTLSRPH